MERNNLKFGETTEKIIGCAMKGHRYFGPGFPEIVYKRALLIELDRNNIKYECEVEKEIFYEGQYIYKRRLDLIIDKQILIELKAISEVDKSCYNQIINYLKIFDLEVGLLINFGAESLQFKRFINTKKNP
jgi:GxxExxY protein